MKFVRRAVLAIALACCSIGAAAAQTGPTLYRAQWGAPGGGNNRPVPVSEIQAKCPAGYPCDVFATTANFGDPKSGTTKQLTIIRRCHSGAYTESVVINENSAGRIECRDGPPSVVRRIGIIEGTWGAGRTADVKAAVAEICGPNAVRCAVPPMEYIFGNPDPAPKRLFIRYSCNGQGTLAAGPGAESGNPVVVKCD